MKKLLLATLMASVTFGVSAGPQFSRVINFDGLNQTSSKIINVEGRVPKRCLLRKGMLGGSLNGIDVLANAKNSHKQLGSDNNKILIANIRAWCNYGNGMTVTFRSQNKGLKKVNGNKKIHYRLIANKARVFHTNQTGEKLDIDWENTHLKNSIKKVPLYIRPVKSGFARAGKYEDTITLTLKAGLL